MSLQTYDDLKSEIAKWLRRPGDQQLAASIPTMIQFAESRINNELRIARMVRFKTINVEGDRFDRPSDFLEMISFGLTDQKDMEFTVCSPRDIQSRSGFYYAHAGDQIVVRDTDDATLTRNFDMEYYAKVPCLCDAEQSWLLSDQPDLYLFGALVFSAPFIGNDARAATWETGYQNALNGLQSRDDKARWSGESLTLKAPARDGVAWR